MISDTLAEAVAQIDGYLDGEAFAGCYGDPGEPLYELIRSTRDEMEALRMMLDDPTTTTGDDASSTAAVAEAFADKFLRGLPETTGYERELLRNAFVSGWLYGHGCEHGKGKAE